MSISVAQVVQQLTGGRGFAFAIMPYVHAPTTMLFERYGRILDSDFGLACLRADDVKLSGHDLLNKIHYLIERADVVIADISARAPGKFSPNVYYEVGYAVARHKPLLLLAQAGTKVPTDLRGLECVPYGPARENLEVFDSELRRHLRLCLRSRVTALRDLLIPTDPTPSVIVANPKYPGKHSRILGQRYDRRTFGDNLGVVGVLAAFGAVLGEMTLPDLVSAEYHDPGLADESANLYLIGSKKVNPLAGEMLEAIQRGWRGPDWYLGCEERKEDEKDDYQVTLYGTVRGHRSPWVGRKEARGGSEVHVENYGLIVRAPHPKHPRRLVTILAGPHTLGTGAACFAATRSDKIEEIRARLGPNRHHLPDKSTAIWALVHGKTDSDGMLDASSISIVEAGAYEWRPA